MPKFAARSSRRKRNSSVTISCCKGDSGNDENPYLIHQELGDLMTRVATVVRRNDQLSDAIGKVNDLHERAMRVSLSDTGNWSNQNVIFAKTVQDMFPLAKTTSAGRFAT